MQIDQISLGFMLIILKITIPSVLNSNKGKIINNLGDVSIHHVEKIIKIINWYGQMQQKSLNWLGLILEKKMTIISRQEKSNLDTSSLTIFWSCVEK